MNLNPYSALPETLAIQSAIFELGAHLQTNRLTIEEVGDYLPGSVMVQDLRHFTNTYMNQKGCDFLKHSKEELEAMGPAYFDNFFPKEEINVLKKDIMKFLQQGDVTRELSFFQRVRPDAQTDYKWYLTTTKLYTADEILNTSQVIHIAIEVSSATYAARKLNYLVEQNELVQKNYLKYISLTPREKEIIKLIVDGKNSGTIADMLFISLHTVNNHRKNIISKLEIKSLSELIKIAVAFNII